MTPDEDNESKTHLVETDTKRIWIMIINDPLNDRFGAFVLFASEELSKQAEADGAYISMEVSAFVVSTVDPALTQQKVIFNETAKYKHDESLDYGFPRCFFPSDLNRGNDKILTFNDYLDLDY